ncbi:MAG: mannonate dehydratase [Candidatus Latescibacteria bacterium]|nr:mannonate dehydratase [Candidatus Latescibacterota bacterium]
MKVLLRDRDLSDAYIQFAQQIGADGFDIHNEASIPGFKEQGYPDLEGLLKLKEKLLGAGLGIFRVAPPVPRQFLFGQPGGEQELDRLCKTVEVLGRAGIPFLSAPLDYYNPGSRGGIQVAHRGGYKMYGFDREVMEKRLKEAPYEIPSVEEYWPRCVHLYERLVPAAERAGVRLVVHPSDPPIPEAHLSLRRWAGLLDAVPSEQSGLLYCVGTRYESGMNIFEEIRYFGGRKKIFHVHFRNVRGTIPTAGGYEEVALDDGDMNMFRVLQTLKEVGYEGALQLDHMPDYAGDSSNQERAWAYAVGYVKALIAALNA